jgi:hypothetical protein
MDAGDHTYLFHSGIPGIMKIGRAADVGLRRRQIQDDVREIHNDAVVSIAVLWKYCGPVEKHLLRLMAPHKAKMGNHVEYFNCDVSSVLKIFPDALAAYQEENAVNFGSCEYERAAKRRRVESELEENALRADARRAEELKEQEHKQALELSQLEFQIKKNKLLTPTTTTPEQQQQQRQEEEVPPPTTVTLEMVMEFASKYLTSADRQTASTCGEIHRALAKQSGLTKTVPNSFTAAGRAAFQNVGFKINQNTYWKEGKPYRLTNGEAT